MFITQAGTPAGYGYFERASVANENIVPDMIKYLQTFENFAPISIGTISIQTKGDTKVSINGRAPILVTAEQGVTFDARGITSIVFDNVVQYNICLSY